jgi:hypothetical protein
MIFTANKGIPALPVAETPATVDGVEPAYIVFTKSKSDTGIPSPSEQSILSHDMYRSVELGFTSFKFKHSWCCILDDFARKSFLRIQFAEQASPSTPASASINKTIRHYNAEEYDKDTKEFHGYLMRRERRGDCK